jgi:DNA-binding MarR family transcriptional regulator
VLAVASNPRISNAELARAAFVTPQTVQAILVNLECCCRILRSRHQEHDRVISNAAGSDCLCISALATC